MSMVIKVGDGVALQHPESRDRFVARQPVFNMKQEIFAYGLLARQADDGAGCLCADPTVATASVLHEIINTGHWERLFGDSAVLVNFTSDAVMRGDYEVLPPQKLIVKLVAEADPLPGLIEACERLHKRGYQLAVDHYTSQDACAPLMAVADIIIVDFAAATAAQRLDVVRSLGPLPAKLLAAKVELQEDFQQASELGFDYCLGYFFCKPQILRNCDVGDSQESLMHLAATVSEPILDLQVIEDIFRGDPALSYKLLRYLNSVSLGIGQEVTSISHALRLLGEKPLRRWAWLVTMASLGQDKPRELTAAALIRARLGERLVEIGAIDTEASEAFLVGLLSLIEPMIERPLDDVLAELPVSVAIKAALLGAPTPLGTLIELAEACERCDAVRFNNAAARLHLKAVDVGPCYYGAIDWAAQVLAV